MYRFLNHFPEHNYSTHIYHWWWRSLKQYKIKVPLLQSVISLFVSSLPHI